MRELKGIAGLVVIVLGTFISCFHLYTAYFGVFPPFIQRGVHLMVLLPLAFLLYPARKNSPKHRITVMDGILFLLAIFPSLFVILQRQRIEDRIELVDPVLPVEILLGILIVILAMEAIRRAVTPVMALLVGIFLLYNILGPVLPGILHHRGMSFSRHVELLYLLTGQGVYGVLLGISATYVALFVLFGSFVLKTGAGEFFSNLARALAGGSRGGPAKIAVMSSGCFGTMTGSAVANVYATGSFTIPMMKRLGYRPEFAGAVEAAASTGGQLMPPIMGAGAFILAETLGMEYISVALKAAISAVLYFVAVGMMVHFRALKRGLLGEPKELLPKLSHVLPNAHPFIPVIALFYLLIAGYSPLMAGFASTVLAVAVSYLKKDTIMTPKKIIDALVSGAKNTVMVAIALVGAQMIVAVVAYTGLALSFASMIVAASKGILLIALLFVAIVAIILGMGIPTTAAYVISATIGASALIRLGVDPYAAHLFTFYFAIISNVTPPVAVAAYAASGVATSDPIRTGYEAFLLAAAGYIIPFMFVYNPALVLTGSVWEIIRASLTAALGIIALAAGLQGWLIGPANIIQKILLCISSFMLIWASLSTDILGGCLIGLCVAWQKFSRSKQQK
ncbi:MAG: TRAP transporter fused permease subunit [Deltaproteobacteria bacterium]|nr:TRAP transporter fused permease subunit [Deltaproteobacteria bacterium]MBW2308648.1 TRAP transporter fused permease subunit [Deltaproteobacteria bacterium]